MIAKNMLDDDDNDRLVDGLARTRSVQLSKVLGLATIFHPNHHHHHDGGGCSCTPIKKNLTLISELRGHSGTRVIS